MVTRGHGDKDRSDPDGIVHRRRSGSRLSSGLGSMDDGGRGPRHLPAGDSPVSLHDADCIRHRTDCGTSDRARTLAICRVWSTAVGRERSEDAQDATRATRSLARNCRISRIRRRRHDGVIPRLTPRRDRFRSCPPEPPPYPTARCTNQKSPIAAIAIDPGMTTRRRYHGLCRNGRPMSRNARAMTVS